MRLQRAAHSILDGTFWIGVPEGARRSLGPAKGEKMLMAFVLYGVMTTIEMAGAVGDHLAARWSALSNTFHWLGAFDMRLIGCPTVIV